MSLWYGGRRFYYWDRDRLRARLDVVPNVSVVGVEGFDDGPEFKVVYATISVRDRPGSILKFQSPTVLAGGKQVRLSQIGPYQLWVSGSGYLGVVQTATGKPVASQFYQDWFDIGPEGWFGDLLPGVQIKGVEDVVKNYDRLLAAIEAMPKEGRRKLKDGSEVEYKVVGP